MALETLKGVEKIGGFDVVRSIASKEHLASLQNRSFVEICDNANTIAFKIQDGPIKENGANGCQVDTIIEAAKKIIEGLNKQFPCEENQFVIAHLGQALNSLNDRKNNRVARGVEGFSNA